MLPATALPSRGCAAGDLWGLGLELGQPGLLRAISLCAPSAPLADLELVQAPSVCVGGGGGGRREGGAVTALQAAGPTDDKMGSERNL